MAQVVEMGSAQEDMLKGNVEPKEGENDALKQAGTGATRSKRERGKPSWLKDFIRLEKS